MPLPGLTRTAADKRYATFDAVRRNLRGQHPVLTKSANNPQFVLADQSSDFLSMQWPQVINFVQETGAVGPHGETYGLLISTDHEGSTGRIGYMYLTAGVALKSAHRTDWVWVGTLYQDTTAGNQCETQWVVYNPVTSLWHLYYHMVAPTASNSEATLLATSPNFTTWTRVGVVLDWPSSVATGYPDSGSFGYFRPFRSGGQWYGHGLLQGTNYGRFALWQSQDGIEWVLDPRPLGNGADMTQYVAANLRINWNQGNVVAWNGEAWWVGLIATFSSGGGSTASYLVACRITQNFRNLIGTPIQILSSLQSWENGDNRGGCALVDADGSLIYVYTNTTDASSPHVTGVGMATGV
jgi:hypothetical protein